MKTVATAVLAMLLASQVPGTSEVGDQVASYEGVYPIHNEDGFVRTKESTDLLSVRARFHKSEEGYYILTDITLANSGPDAVQVAPLDPSTMDFEVQIDLLGKWETVPLPDFGGRITCPPQLKLSEVPYLFPGYSNTVRLALRSHKPMPYKYRIRVTNSLFFIYDENGKSLEPMINRSAWSYFNK